MGPSHEMQEKSLTKVILFCHIDKQEQACRREAIQPRRQAVLLLAGQSGRQFNTRSPEDPAFYGSSKRGPMSVSCSFYLIYNMHTYTNTHIFMCMDTQTHMYTCSHACTHSHGHGKSTECSIHNEAQKISLTLEPLNSKKMYSCVAG